MFEAKWTLYKKSLFVSFLTHIINGNAFFMQKTHVSCHSHDFLGQYIVFPDDSAHT